MHEKLVDYYNSQLTLLMKILENSHKIAQIESRLTKYNFLSRANLPGYLDGIVFQNLQNTQKYPDRKANPYLYHWYILMRQFASSTIRKWIDKRLYFDTDDALIEYFGKEDEGRSAETAKSIGCVSPSREQNAGELKSPKLELIQVQYVIDVLLKEYSEQIINQLKRCLENYRVQIFAQVLSRQVKIKCGAESNQRQEIVNLVSKIIEYENLQVKRYKKIKSSCKLQPIRQ